MRRKCSFETSQLLKNFRLPMKIEKLNLTVDVMKAGELESVLDLTARIFIKDEPMVTFLKLKHEEMEKIGRDLQMVSTNPMLTIVIKDAKNEIVGAGINTTLSMEDHKLPDDASPVVGVLTKGGQLYKEYIERNKLVGNIVVNDTAAVDAKYRGRDLGTYLNYASWMLALNLGYKRCEALDTSIFSQRTSKVCGLVQVDAVNYKNFVHKGQKPFVGLDEAYTKHINAKGRRKYTTTATFTAVQNGEFDIVIPIAAKQLGL